MNNNNICILAASSRKNSQTLMVAKAIKLHLETLNCKVSIPDFTLYDIPFFNGTSPNLSNLTAFQTDLVNSLSAANRIIILSPEYNWTISSELLNFFHQFGGNTFANIWNNKVFSIAGVSSGRGGKFPTTDAARILGKILGFLHFNSYINPTFFESQFTNKSINIEGESLGNLEYDKGLQNFCNTALSYASGAVPVGIGTELPSS